MRWNADLKSERGRMNELALFAGAGGGILGGQLLGWRTVCAVEFDPYAASVLLARQNDGLLAPFPIWDDVRTFDGRPWAGRVDVVAGGFPCQDISAAGKGAGITGERSGLWVEMARIIGEVRPRYAFVENSPILTVRGLGVVLGDLAAMGYDARWGVLGASNVGAPHKRERIWIRAELANARCPGLATGRAGGREAPDGQVFDVRPANRGCDVANPERAERRPKLRSCDGLARGVGLPQRQKGSGGSGTCSEALADADSARWQQPADQADPRPGSWESRDAVGWPGWWKFEPDVGRVADGVAARVDRLKAIGNGQVPQCAAEAWRKLANW